MGTLVNANDIRAVRPMAENISDEKRVNTYIAEAEQLQLIPAIGAKLYEELSSNTSSLTDEQKKTLMDGNFYDDSCGGRQYCGGVKKAIGYLAYARFLPNNPMNATSFGVTIKKSEFSTPAGEPNIIYSSAQAKKVGEAYLMQCVDYLKSINALPSCKRNRQSIKFKAIG